MATATLQTFNVFLTEKLTAAALDIYGFVEKTITDYQEEVYRTKLENQRLQRLLDLVYKPDIRLHRADSRQIDLPSPTQEEQQIKTECPDHSNAKESSSILPHKMEEAGLRSRSVEIPAHLDNSFTDSPTQVVTVQEYKENQMPDSLIQAVTVREHTKYEMPSQHDQPLSSFGATPTAHAAEALPNPTNESTHFVCGKTTGSKGQMIFHQKMHTNERPYVCHVCGTSLRLKGHLKDHLRTHTGEKPFNCFICGKHFARSTNMSKHVRNMHKESLPFKCLLCEHRCPRLVRLKQHMKTAHYVIYSV
uniref:zinc finger protein 287-like isoform X2 n=1 Tax=Solea senegalensis TaxID=28829 RepID=UPI001CD82E2D|nr:zinc finger protein 287-like isoform X2 [Solea senegalensis]